MGESDVVGETINMFLTFFLGFILWLAFSWLKRRFISPDKFTQEDIWSKLPADKDMTDTQKRKTYAEARKKFLDENITTRLPFYDETIINQQVKKDFGHYYTGANEGAFALAQRRKERVEAMQKLGQEKLARKQEAAKKQEEEKKHA